MVRRAADQTPEITNPLRIDVVQPRGMSRESAARYLGIGTTKFDEIEVDPGYRTKR
jgi:hypothetical protein